MPTQEIIKAVDSYDAELRIIAMDIHSNPELQFEEHKAAAWLTEMLEKEGFLVERGIAGLDTAFKAVWEGEKGGPVIGLLCEYDALKGLGHACGHNLIAPSSVGAALALKKAFPHLKGRIEVYGTPGEEGGGGKVIMSDKGVFDKLDAAMMCHPRTRNMVLRGGLACLHVHFKYYGKQSHAAAAPEKGISALDAVIHSFVAINSIRQYVTNDVRIHGIILKGGDAPNIVPEFCETEFLIRAQTVKGLYVVRDKVYAACKSSAEAVGAKCKIEEGLLYKERNNNVAMAELFGRKFEELGLDVYTPPKAGGIGSSDMGNVQAVVPAIHPYVQITDRDISTHTPEFAEAAASEWGMKGMNLAAKAIAMTTYDLITRPELLSQIKEEFLEWKKNN